MSTAADKAPAWGFSQHCLAHAKLAKHYRVTFKCMARRDAAAGLHPYAVKSLLWQMLQGLETLHAWGVMHRDLKPSNILVEDNGACQGAVRLADFGLARCSWLPCSCGCLRTAVASCFVKA